jgi:hypothetical protein
VTLESGGAVQKTGSLEHAIDALRRRYADAVTTLEMLHEYRPQVEAGATALENPAAVLEYLDFFADFVANAGDECARIARELGGAPARAHAQTLEQIAAQSAAEQRRCLLFRDKWINKPLPDERMRPLLNEISVITRDQLTAFRDLQDLAARIDEIARTPGSTAPEAKKRLHRRELLTRLFKR